MNKFNVLFGFLTAWWTQEFSKLKVNILKLVWSSRCIANNCKEFTIWRKYSSPYSGIKKFHLGKKWFGLFLIFRYKILDITKALFFNKISSHIKSIVESCLKFLLFGESLIFEQVFNQTVYHVVNDRFIDSDLVFL